MLSPDRPLTERDIQRVRQAALDYIKSRQVKRRGKYSRSDFCAELGHVKISKNKPPKRMPLSTLSEFLNGNREPNEFYVRRIDEFLAGEASRSDSLQTEFAEIGLAREVFGIIGVARDLGSIGLVVMEPGDGKTTIARAFQATRDNVLLITVQQRRGDAAAVVDLLYRALELGGSGGFNAKRDQVEAKLHRNRSLCVLVDESQKLTPSGLEMLRDLHDGSDDAGDGKVPFVLFGDHDFYKLVLKSRRGEFSPIKPQLTRRIFPVFDSKDRRKKRGGGRSELFNERDIARILNNEQLRIVSDDAIRWLCKIANMRGRGSLGTAINVVRLGYLLRKPEQPVIEVGHLQRAINMTFSRDDRDAIFKEVGAERAVA